MHHRFYQWAWEHHRRRYSWWVCAHWFAVGLPVYIILTALIVASVHVERPANGGYLATYLAALTVATLVWLATLAVVIRPGLGVWQVIRRWVPGEDTAPVLVATYAYGRRAVPESLVIFPAVAALLGAAVAVIAGASWTMALPYGMFFALAVLAAQWVAAHTLIEMQMWPIRAALGGDGNGDALPRGRPTFATWSEVSMFAVSWVFCAVGSMLSLIVVRAPHAPVISIGVAVAFALVVAVPIAVGVGFAPSLRPIQDLTEGTARVAAGDFTQRLSVYQDDDLGVLSASFNRMQAGLVERLRLQSAFGTYVDPDLAVRLLEQGDDVFSGERREVTVMFVDIRDFTPFAEANTAEDAVARLNELFEIVVPVVVDGGGHVNKFLGDGALAVFGAPNDLAGHVDAAVTAALAIQHRVAQQFGDELRIGIGVNTGPVIAGTIGGGGKLEFTLIGDTVNVAARVEQLTKTTGDAILLTQQSVDALASTPSGLIDRGSHALKGKSSAVRVFGLDF